MPFINGGGGGVGLPATWQVPANGGIAITPSTAGGNYVDLESASGHSAFQIQASNSDPNKIGQVTIDSSSNDTLIEGTNGQGTTLSLAHDKVFVGNGSEILIYPDSGSGAFLYFIAGNLLFQSANAATADGNLNAGNFSLWLDQTNGAAKLMVKAKQANGTVVGAAVALS